MVEGTNFPSINSQPSIVAPTPSTSPSSSLNFLRSPWLLIALAIFPLLALIEWAFGRSPLGPDGHFGLWTANIWGPECSQRIADPYAFSHIIHGMAFYGLLWLVARRLPLSARYFIAVLI